MENISKISNYCLLTLLLIFTTSKCIAQKDNLFILRFEGQPYLKYSDSTALLTRGAVIDHKTKLIMQRDDIAYLINNKGDVFELHETGTFKHKDLLKLKALNTASSYSQKLVAYLWKEFTNTLNKDYSKSGFVYRGDFVQLSQPLDSVQLYSNEIFFEWATIEEKTKPYYFVLNEKGSDKVTKIGIHDSKITLFVDDINLKYGRSYRWAVVESKYENLDKIEFNEFKILSKEEYEQKQPELSSMYDFLMSLGFDEKEIKTLLVDYSKIN